MVPFHIPFLDSRCLEGLTLLSLSLGVARRSSVNICWVELNFRSTGVLGLGSKEKIKEGPGYSRAPVEPGISEPVSGECLICCPGQAAGVSATCTAWWLGECLSPSP